MGEAAYYGCRQEEAVLEAAADINILELQCLGHQGLKPSMLQIAHMFM